MTGDVDEATRLLREELQRRDDAYEAENKGVKSNRSAIADDPEVRRRRRVARPRVLKALALQLLDNTVLSKSGFKYRPAPPTPSGKPSTSG